MHSADVQKCSWPLRDVLRVCGSCLCTETAQEWRGVAGEKFCVRLLLCGGFWGRSWRDGQCSERKELAREEGCVGFVGEMVCGFCDIGVWVLE